MGNESKQSNDSGIKGIEIRANGSVRINFRFQGVSCRETLKNIGDSKKELKYASNLRSEILNKIATNTFNYGEFFPDSPKAKLFGYKSGDVLMNDLFDEYLKEVKQTVQHSTYEGYRKSVKGHLLKKFGNIQVRHLSPKLIKEWILSIPTTAKTIKNHLIPLNAVLGITLNDGLINENPLKRLDVSQLLKNKNKSEHEIDPFTTEEMELIFSVATDAEKNLFQFAFFSGLRTSELIGLRWSDVDFNENEVNVCRAVILGKEKGTKTEKGTRTIPLLPQAIEALKRQRDSTKIKNGRVFRNPKTSLSFSTDKQVRESLWRPLLNKAGVRYRNPYQTRHTFASMLISKGENIWMVAQFMGHNNTQMIQQHYGKWLPENKKSQYKNDYSKILA
jgi:integrase